MPWMGWGFQTLVESLSGITQEGSSTLKKRLKEVAKFVFKISKQQQQKDK